MGGEGDKGEGKGDGWGVRAEAEKDAAGVGGFDKAVGTEDHPGDEA